MRTHLRAQKVGWHSLVLAALFVLTGLLPRGLPAQEPDIDVYFDASESTAEAPCPPSFSAFYVDDVFGTFWGRSSMTMSQTDETTTNRFFTYKFSGTTLSGRTRVKGTHHVNAAQCTNAAWHYWLGIPAYIAVLHNAQFSSLACSGGTGSSGTSVVTEVTYDPYSADSGGDCTWTGESGGGGDPDEGSGTQYQPGDSTGGETVDWSTGKGDGGSSVCGAAAVVEYICIEIYNERTGAWDTWSCGYATGC